MPRGDDALGRAPHPGRPDESDDGTRTITETSNGCVRGISGTCKENTEVITLTRE